MKMAEMSMGGSGPTLEPFVESDVTSPRGSTVNDPNGVVGSTGPQVLQYATRRGAFERTFSSLNAGSQRASMLNLVTTAFGSGMLSLPWAFAQTGLILSLFLLAVAGFVSYLSLKMLANSGYATAKKNYTDVVDTVLGPRVSFALQVLLLVYAVGSVIGYYIFIGSAGPQVLVSLNLVQLPEGPPDAPDVVAAMDKIRMWFLIGVSIFPIAPMSMVRRISSFRYLAIFSISAMVTVTLFVVGSAPRLIWKRTDLEIGETLFGRLTLQRFLSSCSIMIYSYCCHLNMFASSFEMHDPSPRRVEKILRRSCTMEFAVYAVVGVCGSLSWGSLTPSVITSSYPSDDPMATFARLCVVFALLVCVPVNVYSARGVVYDRTPPESEASTGFHVGLTLFLVVLCCSVAIVLQSIVDVLGFLGGGCAVTFMFVLPSICTYKLQGLGLFASSPSIGRADNRGVFCRRVPILVGVVIVGYCAAGCSLLSLLHLIPKPA
jgi:amino acid permease